MTTNPKTKRRFINKSEVPPTFTVETEESSPKNYHVQSYRLPKIYSPTISSMKTITSTNSRSTSQSTRNILQRSLSGDMSINQSSSVQFLQMQIFKKKNLWLLIPELLKAKDVRQSLSVLEIMLDSIRENLFLANLISDMPAKKDIEIVHDKFSTCFRVIQKKLQSCSGTEIFTRKFLSEIRFSIHPLTMLFEQYTDSINIIKKFLSSISSFSFKDDKEAMEFVPSYITSNVKSIESRIIVEHARLVSLMDQMKCLARHSSRRLQPLINAGSGDKIKKDLEKLATRAIKFYEKTYQELACITRVSQKELQNSLFQMESELAFVACYYKRFLQLSTEISKMIPKQEKYLDVQARTKQLHEQVLNSHQIIINKNTQVPALEPTSPNCDPSILFENIKQLKGEIMTLKKSLPANTPTEDTSILVNQLYRLAKSNRDLIHDAERMINKSKKILKSLDFLKKLSSLMQELSSKNRTLQDEVEVLLNENEDIEMLPADQRAELMSHYASKRNEIRHELLNYYSQILSQVVQVQNCHPELENITNIVQKAAKTYIHKAEHLVFMLCSHKEHQETISSAEFYQNFRIIMKKEGECFPNFLNNPELRSLVDQMLDIAGKKISIKFEKDIESDELEEEINFFEDLSEGLTYLKTFSQIFEPFVKKYFISPEEKLEHFEDFFIGASELSERVQDFGDNSKLDWELVRIASEQRRYIGAVEECLKLIRSMVQLISLDVLISEESFETLLETYYKYLNGWMKFKAGFNNHEAYSSLLFRFHEKIVQTVEVLQLLKAAFENKDYYLTIEEAAKISKFLQIDTELFAELSSIKELVENTETLLALSANTSENVNAIVNLWYQKHEIDFDRAKLTAEKNEKFNQSFAKKLEVFKSKFSHIDKNQSMLSKFAKYRTESLFLADFLKLAAVKSEYNNIEEKGWELVLAEKSVTTLKANLFQRLRDVRLKIKSDYESLDHSRDVPSELQTAFAEYLKNLIELQATEIHNEIELSLSEDCAPVQECLKTMKTENFVAKFYGLISRKMAKQEMIPPEIQNLARKYGLLFTISGKCFYRTDSKAYLGKVTAIVEIGGVKYNCKLEETVRITAESVEIIEGASEKIISEEKLDWLLSWVVKPSRLYPSELTFTISEF